MRPEHRLSPESGLRSQQVHRSLHRHLWTERCLQCIQSRPHVQLLPWNERKRFRSLLSSSRYQKILFIDRMNDCTTAVDTDKPSPSLPVEVAPETPCSPSPCGPNSQCRPINGQAVCSCVPGYSGSPPSCRPECVVSSDCPRSEACSNLKCANPCIGSCGVRAQCQVINHNPICSCPPGLSGDPFLRCEPISKTLTILQNRISRAFNTGNTVRVNTF